MIIEMILKERIYCKWQ